MFKIDYTLGYGAGVVDSFNLSMSSHLALAYCFRLPYHAVVNVIITQTVYKNPDSTVGAIEL